MKSFTGKSFLTLLDFSPEEIGFLLDLAADLKQKKKSGLDMVEALPKDIALSLLPEWYKAKDGRG